MQKSSSQGYEFGDFTLDLARCSLQKGQEQLRLRPKPFEVLRYLVENKGRLVSKDELIEAVWSEAFVTDDSLVQCLVEIRKALGDESQRYIRTIPRRGYLFDADVRVIGTEDGASQRESSAYVGPLSRHLRWLALGMAALAAGIGLYILFSWDSIDPKRSSVAVLPFKNLTEDKTNEYFSDGVTEDIITQLSRIADLKVVSRTSVMRYKNTTKDIRQIGSELGVATVLQGSVRREGNRVRIATQLIDARTDEHVWAETYDRELKDIFEIQGNVAEQIATALKSRFIGSDTRPAERRPTRNVSAYDYYLRGREHYYLYRVEDVERAIEFFEKAIELDPDYALAYAGLSDAYASRAVFPFTVGALDDLPGLSPYSTAKAIEMARKAISLDSELAEAHKALGHAYVEKGWYSNGLAAMKKAIELNPNHEPAVNNLGFIYLFLGKPDEALPWLEKSLELNPAVAQPWLVALAYWCMDLDVKAEEWFNRALQMQRDLDDVYLGMSWFYLSQRKYGQARAAARNILSVSPDYPAALHVVGTADLRLGRYAEAERTLSKLVAIHPTGRSAVPPCNFLTSLGYVLLKLGRRDEAQKKLDESRKLDEEELQRGHESSAVRYDLAAIHSILGDEKAAYDWLEKAIAAGWNGHRLTRADPLLENLHESAQFQQRMDALQNHVAEVRRGTL